MTETRKLRVFLCHSSQDKPIVRELYQRLNAEGWIDPWLDEEKLLPGQDWDMEIEKAVEAADAVIVCLSSNSVPKEGYVQKELRFALGIALEKPEETIFILPIRLDECVVPRSLRSIQYIDFFPRERNTVVFKRLMESLQTRASKLDIVYELKNIFNSSDHDGLGNLSKTSSDSNGLFQKLNQKPQVYVKLIAIKYSTNDYSLYIKTSRLAEYLIKLGYKVQLRKMNIFYYLNSMLPGNKNQIFYGKQDCLKVINYFQDIDLLSHGTTDILKFSGDINILNENNIDIVIYDELIFGKEIGL